MGESAILILATPAVPVVAATTALVGSAAYVFMKSYCNSTVVKGIASELYSASIDGTVDTITVVVGTYKIAVDQTSQKIEAASEIRDIAIKQQGANIEKAINSTADVLCRVDPDCR